MREDEQIADTRKPPTDPRISLATWANQQDEWIRYIVRQVLSTARSLPESDLTYTYDLFRQEKALDNRELPVEQDLAVDSTQDDAELPLAITKVADVMGVNALVPGSVIEPHAGITILFGENGTGKTGYSRIFKAIADSRTADRILGDIAADSEKPQSAKISYTLGAEEKNLVWSGQRGHAPFTRMSIFDSPSVNFHVDDDLEYVYVPTVLSLFKHVIAGVKSAQARIDTAVTELGAGSSTLLSRFPKDSSVYPLVETLGASTDLTALKALADNDPKIDERIDVIRRAVAALEANTLGAEIALRQRGERVLKLARIAAETLAAFDAKAYNDALAKRAELQADYTAFRSELFQAADLPAEPEATWEAFVSSGEAYRQYLDGRDVHDADRCLYCRQPLADPAKQLVQKYGDYLVDKISKDITEQTTLLAGLTGKVRPLETTEISTLLAEQEGREDQATYCGQLSEIVGLVSETRRVVAAEEVAPLDGQDALDGALRGIKKALTETTAEIVDLREQVANRTDALRKKKRDLAELITAAELAKSWDSIQGQVERAKEADRLRILLRPIPGIGRAVTELAKQASDQLINQNFDKLFVEECTALRAPSLKVEFVGRQGKAQRRKVLGGKHKPSKVLSEGEQKVLAMADFLAEARLAGITAPVIFDDPVSSLDHRRINEVAQRIALLAEDNQVIVFTHDIFFATTLLALFEKSKRCSYFHITDDEGKGKVTRASGPRWDTLSSLKGNINKTIAAAKAVDGEARAALVREGYDWIRSWCEVFTETELLQGVSQRYQPNIRMTVLPNIKTNALPAAIEVVTRVFEDACRYIAGHSQPLITLGVAPTLPMLESHWSELEQCRTAYVQSD
ncbi:AAA family ATPase [Arthrobacter sp. UYCu723]